MYANARMNKHHLTKIASQISFVVLHRPDRRRRGTRIKQQCDSSVYRSSNRDGLGPARYVLYSPRLAAFDSTENVSKDLESFAKHAGRSQVSTDDVMLLARRNEGLEALLRSFIDKSRKDKESTTTGRGGRK
jgi:hypothetical protein